MPFLPQSTSTFTQVIPPGVPGPILTQPEVPISQLPLAAKLSGSEYSPIVQNGITCRALVTAIASSGGPPVYSNKGVTQSLYYAATLGQTVFPLSTPDQYGNTFTLSLVGMSVQVTQGAVRLALDDGSHTFGGFTIDFSSNTITLIQPCALNMVVIIDIVSAPPVTQRVVTEQLTVSSLNTIAALSHVADGEMTLLFVNRLAFFSVGTHPSFTVSGQNVGWVDLSYSVNPGDLVVAVYTHS